MTTLQNRFIILKRHIPQGETPKKEDFEIRTERQTFTLSEHEFLCQTMYLSTDPYMRFLMKSDNPSGTFQPGSMLYGYGCGRVIESKCPAYQVGDVICSFKEWIWPTAEYCKWHMDDMSQGRFKKITKELWGDEAHYSWLVGVLGMTGFTAYAAVNLYGKMESGKTVVISGACGAVGHIAGQLARNMGVRVVGLTSTKEKMEMLKNELGFDEALCFEAHENVSKMEREIKEKIPSGIDYFIDNVGGELSNAVLRNMNRGGKVVLVGLISQYNKDAPNKFEMLPSELEKFVKEREIEQRSFVISEHKEIFDEAFEYLLGLLKSGKLKSKENIYKGIQYWPDSFIGHFEGKSAGKSMIEVGPKDSDTYAKDK